MTRISATLLLSLLATLPMAGCAGLRLTLYKTSVQKPSNVVLYYSVEHRNGEPVGGLEAGAFQIYEDDQLISPFESKQTILNPEVAVAHYTLLLVDLSGSITESGSIETLIASANTFAERITRREKIAVFGFDGSAKLLPLVDFTGNSKSISRGLNRLSGHKSRDPSTNLNGAVVAAVARLEKQMSRAKQPLRFGTLVVFTDGTDRAHRVTEDQMSQVLDEAQMDVFVIGLGAEISDAQLSAIGRTGFVKADQPANMTTAFEQVASRIESSARKFYLLSYCSPSRAGKHTLRVEVEHRGQGGSVTHQFDAAGFGPNCDPSRPPRFSVGKVVRAGAPK